MGTRLLTEVPRSGFSGWVRRVFGDKPRDFTSVPAPYIGSVHEFLRAFLDSQEARIQFKSSDLISPSNTTACLRPLAGKDYEKVRLRLRAISNLNPVTNLQREEGLIRVGINSPTGMLNYQIRSIFGAKGEFVAVEKIQPTQPR